MKALARRLLAWTLAISMLTSGTIMGMAADEAPVTPSNQSSSTEQQPDPKPDQPSNVSGTDGELPGGGSDLDGELPGGSSDTDGELPSGSSDLDGSLPGGSSNLPNGSSNFALMLGEVEPTTYTFALDKDKSPVSAITLTDPVDIVVFNGVNRVAGLSLDNCHVAPADALKIKVRGNNDVLGLTGLKGGEATFTYTDETGTATVAVTVKMPSFVDSEDNMIAGISLGYQETKELTISDGTNKITDLKLSDFGYDTHATALEVNEDTDVITVKRIQYLKPTRDLTLNYNREGKDSIVLKLDYPTQASDGMRILLAEGRMDATETSPILEGKTVTVRQGYTTVSGSTPILLGIYNNGVPYAIPNGNASGSISLFDKKITKHEMIVTQPEGNGEKKPFTLEEMSDGSVQLSFDNSCTQGAYTVKFNVTYGEHDYTTGTYTINLIEGLPITDVPVATTESINAALATIKDKGDIDYLLENPHRINLTTGTHKHADDATILIDIPVIIAGVEGTIVESELRYNLPRNDAVVTIQDFTLQARAIKTGTGIEAVDGNKGTIGSGGNVTIDNFNIGINSKVGQHVNVGATIKNCNIGKSMNTPQGTTTSYGMYNFESNAVAFQVREWEQNTSKNPFSLGVMYCNFKGNTVNIENNSGIAFNFSFNYFDNVDESKFTGTVKPLSSPYYSTEITDMGSLPNELKLAAHELSKVQVNAAVLTTENTFDTTNFTADTKIDLVEPGTVKKLSGWDFESINEVVVVPTNRAAVPEPFKPAIATKLPPTSQTVVDDKLAAGTNYQPVAFAHHGPLPGTANVSVTQSATAAPNSGLKLYKIENGDLVLQEGEIVTLVNGEYQFKRNDCSDYIITGIVSSGSTGGSTGGGSTGGGTVTGDDIASKLDKTPAGSEVAISVSGSPNVSGSVFEMFAKNPDKTLVLKGDGFTWSFAGADIGSMAGLPTFNATISNASPNQAAVSKIAGNADLLNVYFAYHGKLPGKATVELQIPAKYRDKALNFYYINTKTGKPELVASGIKAFNNKAKVQITHCSDYVLTPDKLAGATSSTGITWTNPETGGPGLAVLQAMMVNARIIAAMQAVGR